MDTHGRAFLADFAHSDSPGRRCAHFLPTLGMNLCVCLWIENFFHTFLPDRNHRVSTVFTHLWPTDRAFEADQVIEYMQVKRHKFGPTSSLLLVLERYLVAVASNALWITVRVRVVGDWADRPSSEFLRLLCDLRPDPAGLSCSHVPCGRLQEAAADGIGGSVTSAISRRSASYAHPSRIVPARTCGASPSSGRVRISCRQWRK